jgi:hypothetical protein
MTFTVPEALRPFIRSYQRPAYQAMVHASATALKRLAHDERFIGTDLPGFTGILHKVGPATQPGAGNSSLIPTSPIAFRAVASPRIARAGAPPAPISLSP